jgi:ABC-type branched-subunit amino acid transport system substrate-binding protein
MQLVKIPLVHHNVARLSIGLAAAVVLTAAACSSSPSQSSPSAGGSTSDPGTNLSGSPLLVYVLESQSAAAFANPETAVGAQMAADLINSQGGIDGHPVKIQACDTALDPQMVQNCVTQGIAAKASVFTGWDNYGAQTFPALEKAGIPWLGGDLGDPIAAQNPISFPTNGLDQSAGYGLADVLLTHGAKKISVLALSVTAAIQYGDTVLKAAGQLGGSAAGSVVPYQSGAPDMTSFVARALAQHPDGLALISAGTDEVNLVKAARTLGFTGPISAIAENAPDNVASAIGSVGAPFYVVGYNRLPWVDDSTPQAKEFMTLYDKLSPSQQAQRSGYMVQSFASLLILQQTMKGAKSVSAASVDAALRQASSINIEITPTINFTKSAGVPEYPRVVNTQVIYYQLKGSSYAELGNNEFTNPYAVAHSN